MYVMRVLRQINMKRLHPSLQRMFCSKDTDEVPDASIQKPMVPVLTGERSVNKVTLIGRLGRDPEMRGTETRPVAIFSLATSQSFKNANGEYFQKTDWHRVAVFRPRVMQWVLSNLQRGDRVFVMGAIRYGTFLDKVTQQDVKAVSIVAEDIVSLMKGSSERNLSDSPNSGVIEDEEYM